ncbi:MAG TPA: AAA family ATPase [Candidatus Limnocylindrales bacterium]|nr:AAA family ATPase [Candidatus Limnocylindrales bacterium]
MASARRMAPDRGSRAGMAQVDHPSLGPAALCAPTDPASLGFRTTADLPDLDEVVGQDRAVDAVAFAVGMHREGYNLYALGPEGIGKQHVIRGYLERQAARQPRPDDWAYVNRFDKPQQPRSLRLPPGRAAVLAGRMERLVGELRATIPAAFEAEAYREHRSAIEDALKQRRDAALEAFDKTARAAGVGIVRTPLGLALGPIVDGEIVDADRFRTLAQDRQAVLREALRAQGHALEELLHQIPGWERETRDELQKLDRDTTSRAAGHLIAEVRREFADLPQVIEYLEAVEKDVIESADEFVAAASGEAGAVPAALRAMLPEAPGGAFRRYKVNVLIDSREAAGAPVVYEDHPTQPNLMGRVEHSPQLGALVTDFTLVRPGALHRANGGYLVLDARKLLVEPYAWDELKRALRAREIRLEPLGVQLGLIPTVSLEPEPIPLDVKVVLVGDRAIYHLLAAADPDFLELFKVPADFDERADRTPETNLRYARLLATIGRRESIRALDAGAVARALDEASRRSGDTAKISTSMRSLTDLVREADHWAAEAGHEVVTAGDVERAIEAQQRRAGRLRDLVLEEIVAGTVHVDVTGAAVGQVNGLSVVQLGETVFGQPSRISASVRLGRGEVVDIEREVDLGGPIHSKGVLILSGFIGSRYAERAPLAFHASLAFEQSYGGVEGDSASLAEACALLSAIARLPLRQDLAVTGSIDQLGVVQAVGGINEKIEGFFDLCAAHGLSGSQGVVIPATNVRHLMLRQPIIDAVAAGRFGIYPVASVDAAMELLTGLPAGAAADGGEYPAGSVNARVGARLLDLAERARRFGAGAAVVGQAGSGPVS